MKSQNYINHIALVLDASGSMQKLSDTVVEVADQQIKHLAQRSQELDQETRATVYTFEGSKVECIFYDKDVLRMPSIKGRYHVGGMTNLIDATLKAISDLQQTPELYGDHSFLTYVLTDGAENNSVRGGADLARTLDKLPDHWTLACFVPDAVGVSEAKRFGFAKDNIAVWDTSAKGFKEVGETIRRTTDLYMQGRATGHRGSRNLFHLDTSQLSAVSVAGLKKLGPGQFRLLAVGYDTPIAPFVEHQTGRPYRLGEAYYQLTKPVEIQPQKTVALYDRKAHAVYTGAEARQLLGLPNYTVKVDPVSHPKFEIFIQSTSVNRKLFAGTRVLLLS